MSDRVLDDGVVLTLTATGLFAAGSMLARKGSTARRFEEPMSLSQAQKLVDKAIRAAEYDVGLGGLSVSKVRFYLDSYTDEAETIPLAMIRERIALRRQLR